jgi:uncharacterized membrane protein YjgN (DUF898 family)
MTQPPSYPTPPGYAPPPEHPRASTVLVLGILGLVLCGVLAPFAWVMGKSTLEEIDASGGRWGGRSNANTGYILGIVGSVLLGVGILMVAGYILVMLVVFGSMAAAG